MDELLAGVPTLGAPGIRGEFALDYGALATIVLSVPLVFGLFVESPLLLLSKRLGRRRLAGIAFGAMAVSALAAACSATAWQLALSLSLSATAGGLALALVETVVMDAAPYERELWMTRWTLGGALGDLAAPGLLAVLATIGFGWRGAFVVAACMTVIAACVVTRHMPNVDNGGEGHATQVPIRVALRRAFANQRLLSWSLGAVVCDLLDEIFVVAAVLFLRDVRGVDAGAAALALAVLPAAGTAGLLLSQRMLDRIAPLRWLATNCVACALGIVGFVAIPTAGAAVAMLAVVGFTAASMWPIATAQAYRALPGASTTVAAVPNLFAPLSVVMPLAVTAAADYWGLSVAVMLLVVQPLTLLLLSCRRT